jgi:hypothetical protein
MNKEKGNFIFKPLLTSIHLHTFSANSGEGIPIWDKTEKKP